MLISFLVHKSLNSTNDICTHTHWKWYLSSERVHRRFQNINVPNSLLHLPFILKYKIQKSIKEYIKLQPSKKLNLTKNIYTQSLL